MEYSAKLGALQLALNGVTTVSDLRFVPPPTLSLAGMAFGRLEAGGATYLVLDHRLAGADGPARIEFWACDEPAEVELGGLLVICPVATGAATRRSDAALGELVETLLQPA